MDGSKRLRHSNKQQRALTVSLMDQVCDPNPKDSYHWSSNMTRSDMPRDLQGFGRIADAATWAERPGFVDRVSGRCSDRYCDSRFPFDEAIVERASWFEFEPGCSLLTCSAEDLVVLKLFAFRPQALLDVETVVLRQRHTLDWARMEMLSRGPWASSPRPAT